VFDDDIIRRRDVAISDQQGLGKSEGGSTCAWYHAGGVARHFLPYGARQSQGAGEEATNVGLALAIAAHHVKDGAISPHHDRSLREHQMSMLEHV
jgi:hypothetical protein